MNGRNETTAGTIPTSWPRRELREGEIVSPNGSILTPWRKGQSGNPSGVGMSAYHEARRICAKATGEAARRQVELMSSGDERVAFMATEAVLRRGAGVPRDHSGEDDAVSRINLDNLNAEERATLVKLLKRVFGAG
jgi:hypothetical protein